MIGAEPVARTEVIKKLWDYIKANGLQDAANKRAINADAKLKPVFGKDQVTMFELAGIVGQHLTGDLDTGHPPTPALLHYGSSGCRVATR